MNSIDTLKITGLYSLKLGGYPSLNYRTPGPEILKWEVISMSFQWLGIPKSVLISSLVLVLALVVACGSAAPEVVEKEVIVERQVIKEVPKEVVVTEQVIREVPKEVVVTEEVIREVEKEVLREVPKEIIREVILTPTPIPAPAPQVEAKVQRVIYAFGELQESNRHWTVSRPSYYQFDPYAETLVGLDPTTNQRIARLADRWESTIDGKSWTFYLHQDVPFHFGWGEFTAKDVKNAIERTTSDESVSSAGSFFKQIQSIETPSDHEITFHMDFPAVEMPAILSRGFGGGEVLMLSAAQIEKEGYEGLDVKPAGTGSYQYGGRETGQNIWFERAPQPHWRGETPQFQEVEIRWVREDLTRLAMLLTGEAHIASLSRELQLTAVSRGMKNAVSQVPTNYLSMYFGGMYFKTGDATFDPSVPWVDKRVRQAMNIAINRQEMLDYVLRGDGELMLNTSFHPVLRGWSTKWEEDFDELYGYNPDRAAEILKEVGYGPDNPFSFTIWNYISSDEPETPVMVEALINYWQPLGIEVSLADIEWGTVRKYYRNRTAEIKAGGWGNVITTRSMITMLRLWTSENTHWYQSDLMFENYDKFLALETVDEQEIARLIQEVGDEKFYEFSDIPLFWFSLAVTFDPAVVESWTFPGTGSSKTSHWDLLKAAQ